MVLHTLDSEQKHREVHSREKQQLCSNVISDSKQPFINVMKHLFKDKEDVNILFSKNRQLESIMPTGEN